MTKFLHFANNEVDILLPISEIKYVSHSMYGESYAVRVRMKDETVYVSYYCFAYAKTSEEEEKISDKSLKYFHSLKKQLEGNDE